MEHSGKPIFAAEFRLRRYARARPKDKSREVQIGAGQTAALLAAKCGSPIRAGVGSSRPIRRRRESAASEKPKSPAESPAKRYKPRCTSEKIARYRRSRRRRR